MENLIKYDWPGNIRELQNVVERAVIVANGPVVHIDAPSTAAADSEAASLETLEAIERNHIIRALNETGWVVHGRSGAAEILGINPSTLRSRMEKLGIKKPATA
jgi:transcriptional regulator with GAF, ATPase, and Fis domain